MVDSETMRLRTRTNVLQVDPSGPASSRRRRISRTPRSEPSRTTTAEAESTLNEYVVKVQCSGTTLYAFVLEGAQRFITYDQKPRVLTHDVALEIQGRLPQRQGESAISIEKVETHTM